ncbi:snaclec anticoagulant protein subunit B-like [Mizuhopecten yessoensis]|uniref:CD209 antigen-like protein E n=1 Tax=Mizuhopecten yessoensis TaxID=6573 RepID=A0A210PX94_MIZYE|nr:snaclec anticoagulant protein subunit B-like [Mizuhopecten yessoensis]OWF41110.1 CD209 antigen-like protein E [Mizuhopecten yessoensis]
MAFTLLPLLLCSGLVLVMSTCPSEWVEYDGECLYFSPHAMEWHAAENDCRNRPTGSYLVTDDNQEKHDFIKMYINIFNAWHNAHFWTGGSDFIIENNWRWVETGVSIGSTTYWGQGQPDGNSSANCVAFHMNSDNDLVWKDDRCSHKYNFICEQRATDVTNGVIG